MDGKYGVIEHGWAVYTTDDEKLGTVDEVNVAAGYLHLRKGWLFTRDLYVPLGAVSDAGGGAVYLAYTRTEIEARGWDERPSDRLADEGKWREEPTVVVHAPSAERGEAGDAEAGSPLVLRRHEEELVPHTRTIEQGHLGLHTEVVEGSETARVLVRSEVASVERVPMDAAYEGDDAFRAVEFEIPLLSERLYVGKRARVVEEVRVHKHTIVEEQQVTERVRKERVHVEEDAPSGPSGTQARRRQTSVRE